MVCTKRVTIFKHFRNQRYYVALFLLFTINNHIVEDTFKVKKYLKNNLCINKSQIFLQKNVLASFH